MHSKADTSDTSASKVSDFEYDDLYRLISADISQTSGGNDYSRTYTYSAIGNIMNKSDQGDYEYEGIGNANPHAVTRVAGASISYDDNGNMIEDVDGMALLWDYKNRLLASTKDNASTFYFYDHTGQRVKKARAGSLTIYPNKFVEIERGVTTNHIYAGSMLIASIDGSVHYVHNDHLSGSNVVSDESGAEEQLLDYYPFGSVRIDERSSSFDESKKFTGYELDDSGLYYANARYYDGEIGRFVSVDSAYNAVGNERLLKQKTGMTLQNYLASPQVLNSYSYSYNNPLLYKDVGGEFAFVIPIAASAPIWVPIAVTGVAAIGAGATAWFAGESIGYAMEGDTQSSMQSSNNAMKSLLATEAALVAPAGLKALSSMSRAAKIKATIGSTLNVGNEILENRVRGEEGSLAEYGYAGVIGAAAVNSPLGWVGTGLALGAADYTGQTLFDSYSDKTSTAITIASSMLLNRMFAVKAFANLASTGLERYAAEASVSVLTETAPKLLNFGVKKSL